MEADLAGRVERVLLRHPKIRGVRLVGSRARGTPSTLSDWDFVVETDAFDAVARDLPDAVSELEPIAQQWDRISEYPCYMLMLSGPVKVDLIFPDEPYASLPPWTVSAETLDGIDRHAWDWLLWLASKREKGADDLVRRDAVGEGGRGEADARTQLEDVDRAEDLAEHSGDTGGRVHPRGRELEERGLARAVRPEHDPALALLDLPRHVVEDARLPAHDADAGQREDITHAMTLTWVTTRACDA